MHHPTARITHTSRGALAGSVEQFEIRLRTVNVFVYSISCRVVWDFQVYKKTCIGSNHFDFLFICLIGVCVCVCVCVCVIPKEEFSRGVVEYFGGGGNYFIFSKFM